MGDVDDFLRGCAGVGRGDGGAKKRTLSDCGVCRKGREFGAARFAASFGDAAGGGLVHGSGVWVVKAAWCR